MGITAEPGLVCLYTRFEVRNGPSEQTIFRIVLNSPVPKYYSSSLLSIGVSLTTFHFGVFHTYVYARKTKTKFYILRTNTYTSTNIHIIVVTHYKSVNYVISFCKTSVVWSMEEKSRDAGTGGGGQEGQLPLLPFARWGKGGRSAL